MRHTERVSSPRTNRARVPQVVLFITLLLTVGGTSLVLRTSRARDEQRFESTAAETRHLIEIRINTYIELLRAGAALFGASDSVSHDEFHAFVDGLQLTGRYRGIQGIGYATRVPRNQVERLGVWPPGTRPEYTAIVYLEPEDDRNLRAMGYDMFADPIRRSAMERARDTGQPAASGKVTLVQEGDDDKPQPGFLIYVPVYDNRLPKATLEERRAALVGWVYSAFRVDDLFSSILGADRTGPVGFEVFDASPSPGSLLFSHQPEMPPSPHDPLSVQHAVNVGGREWIIHFTGAQHADGATPIWLAPAAFFAGTTLSVALFAITYWQYRARVAAERHAEQLRRSEDALRQSESQLRRLVVLEREARSEAQRADRAKDEFLATLSHELRTPLNAILGWVTMLRTGRVGEERRSGALDVIERNARAQARLIEDLLDVSRIVTGKVRLDVQPLHVGPIVQTAVDALRPGAEVKRVHLHVHIDPAAGYVMGDAARLQQVAWNLLSNAIKFTPQDGHVYLEVAEHDGTLELRVRDTGVGIPADFLPHVFERFRQADSSTTRAHSGVGLGLAIVRHLVELHGGSITAHSDGDGKGAQFVVRLPLADRATAIDAPGDDRQAVDLDGMRVLVVDDDADARDMLLADLISCGAVALGAATAADAMTTLLGRQVDVIVCDIGLPGIDGYEMMRRVRGMTGSLGRVPAIALTAYVGADDRERALDAGYQMHLPKPVDLAALHAALGRLKPTPTT
jgi:signal transduction histidine kinase